MRAGASAQGRLLNRLTHHCDIVEPGAESGASRTAPERCLMTGIS
jgi:hypothetical protein